MIEDAQRILIDGGRNSASWLMKWELSLLMLLEINWVGLELT